MGRLLVRAVAVITVVAIAAFAGRAMFAPAPEVADVATAAPTPQVETVMVQVATQPLTVGTFLDPTEIGPAPWPRTAVTDDMIRPDGALEIIGAVIIETVPAGQPLRTGSLLLPGQDGFLAAVLAPGKRAVSIAVDAVTGNAGHVFPGDRVDLILTHELESLQGREHLMHGYASETILEAVRVIAVDQNLDHDLPARTAANVPRTITLEVTPAEVERVTVAGRIGKLSVSLRSLLVPDADELTARLEPSRAPTWAADVSAVVRAAAGAPEPEDTPPPAIRQVRIHRGSATEVIEN